MVFKIFHPDKPFLDIDDQIKLLESRGLIIENPLATANLLMTLGYYPLINGYSKYYLNKNDHYKTNTKIEYIYTHYSLDQQIQRIVFKRIIDCEDKLKTTLGYLIGKHFDVSELDLDGKNSYLNDCNYQKSKFSSTLLNQIFKKIQETPNNPTRYYRDNKNHVPPWISFRNIDFWQAISMYAILLPDIKQEATDLLLIKKDLFNRDFQMNIIRNGYDILRYFRNQIAHGMVLYTSRSRKFLPIKAINTFFGNEIMESSCYNGNDGLNDLFSLFLVLIIFNPSRTDSEKMIVELINLENSFLANDVSIDKKIYSDFILHSGLPLNYTSLLKKAYAHYISLQD